MRLPASRAVAFTLSSHRMRGFDSLLADGGRIWYNTTMLYEEAPSQFLLRVVVGGRCVRLIRQKKEVVVAMMWNAAKITGACAVVAVAAILSASGLSGCCGTCCADACAVSADTGGPKVSVFISAVRRTAKRRGVSLAKAADLFYEAGVGGVDIDPDAEDLAAIAARLGKSEIVPAVPDLNITDELWEAGESGVSDALYETSDKIGDFQSALQDCAFQLQEVCA